jgi:hypothetical protein
MLKQIINKKPLAIIISCVALLFGCSNSQNIAFQYNGHPVHPLIIKELLPNPESGESIGCISLDSTAKTENIETVNDTITVNKGTWFLSHFSNTGYIDYHFVAMYKNYYCIIVRDVDGTFSAAYICFLSLQNKKLCLNGYLDIANVRDDLITVSGDSLLVGSEKHAINKIIKP